MRDFIPSNEMGVIVLFSYLQDVSGFNIVDIGSRFPDAVIDVDGIEYRTEFEYMLSNFIAHGHDIRQCDIIICWENDLNDSDFPLDGVPAHVVELKNSDWYHSKSIRCYMETTRDIYYWKCRASRAEAKVKFLSSRIGVGNAGDVAIIDDALLIYDRYIRGVEEGSPVSLWSRERMESDGMLSQTRWNVAIEFLKNSGVVEYKNRTSAAWKIDVKRNVEQTLMDYAASRKA